VARRGTHRLPHGWVHTAFGDRTDGDFSVGLPDDDRRRVRRALVDRPWTWLRQVHGARVIRVERPGEGAGSEADAAVTDVAGAVLGVQVADCAPVLFWGPTDGGVAIGAAHAGWRGLRAGVLREVVGHLEDLGAREVSWDLGPCISAGAYEFGTDDLAELEELLGPEVRSTTGHGAPALDLPAAVAAAVAAAGVTGPQVSGPPPCTATGARWWSHRARGDLARQVAAIWWEPSR